MASFRNTMSNIEEGYSWNISDFVNGDFSLTVLRASLDLQGLFECIVDYNSTILHSSNVTLSILGMCLGPWNSLLNLRTEHCEGLFSLSLPDCLRASAVGGVGEGEPTSVPRRGLLPSSCLFLLDQEWEGDSASLHHCRTSSSRWLLHSSWQPDLISFQERSECDFWLQSLA